MPKGLFFIIGIRRSGTSILRDIILKSPDVLGIEYEPHPLWFSTMMLHFDRFNSNATWKRTVNEFKDKRKLGLYGAKFALNPGIDALDWVWLNEAFDSPKFIFINRNIEDSYRSYMKVDKDIKRGIMPENAYFPAFHFLLASFNKFVVQNSSRSCWVSYEKMIMNPSVELAKVWSLLDIRPVKDLGKFIKRPTFWSIK